ncbi:MAG: gephyrin-like molybdotransferase Glp [Kofleriaceae bacterium]
MLSVADAARRVIERVPRLATELVPLDAAIGRILATAIIADRPLPGFDNSAMDGYAVRASEVPGSLVVIGEVAAGAVRTEPTPPGSCVRIFTGAPVPADLDTVVMQEDVTFPAPDPTAIDHVVASALATHPTFPHAPRGDNVRRAGEDVAVGDMLLTAGTRITTWHAGLLAALGVANVRVARRPRVAIIATGDELVTIDTPPGPGQLVASSSHALLALVHECGGDPHVLGIAPDDIGAITTMIETALGEDRTRIEDHAGFDVVITTGGVSVGDRDHVHAALAAAGVTRELYKVAMKPGKPFAFGTRSVAIDARPTPVFGLPGNPVSTLVAFELFVRPALLAMQGATVVDRTRVPVTLATPYRKQAGRAHYLRATVVRDGDRLVAHTHAKQGSAMQSSLVSANALVEIPADTTELAVGAHVAAILVEVV